MFSLSENDMELIERKSTVGEPVILGPVLVNNDFNVTT